MNKEQVHAVSVLQIQPLADIVHTKIIYLLTYCQQQKCSALGCCYIFSDRLKIIATSHGVLATARRLSCDVAKVKLVRQN